MDQTVDVKTQTLVHNALHLLAYGKPADFNMLYRQRQMQGRTDMSPERCAVMDFPYAQRNVFYAYLYKNVLREAPIDYLEFGVAGGGSFKSWLALSKHETSRYYGFDSFEGLPEDWEMNSRKGSFSTNGIIPDVDDARASFVVGLFQQTVDTFSREFMPKNRLVLHMDADLYSSTLYVLMNMDRHIRPGTVILFDEFNARGFTDEYAAMEDYCSACCREYKVLARRSDFAKLAVEMVQ